MWIVACLKVFTRIYHKLYNTNCFIYYGHLEAELTKTLFCVQPRQSYRTYRTIMSTVSGVLFSFNSQDPKTSLWIDDVGLVYPPRMALNQESGDGYSLERLPERENCGQSPIAFLFVQTYAAATVAMEANLWRCNTGDHVLV